MQSSGAGTGAGPAIVRSIVALGHELEKKIVAEGVETAEDVGFLRSIGCQYAQGFYYGEPMSDRDVLQLLKMVRTAEHKLRPRGFFRAKAKGKPKEQKGRLQATKRPARGQPAPQVNGEAPPAREYAVGNLTNGTLRPRARLAPPPPGGTTSGGLPPPAPSHLAQLPPPDFGGIPMPSGSLPPGLPPPNVPQDGPPASPPALPGLPQTQPPAAAAPVPSAEAAPVLPPFVRARQSTALPVVPPQVVPPVPDRTTSISAEQPLSESRKPDDAARQSESPPPLARVAAPRPAPPDEPEDDSIDPDAMAAALLRVEPKEPRSAQREPKRPPPAQPPPPAATVSRGSAAAAKRPANKKTVLPQRPVPDFSGLPPAMAQSLARLAGVPWPPEGDAGEDSRQFEDEGVPSSGKNGR